MSRATSQSVNRASGIVRWHSSQALVDGYRKVRTIDRDVHHCEHPLLDARFYLGIGLLNPTEFGLVSDDEADAMYDLEDEIKAELGQDAVLVARDSNSGFRTLHFYYDTESDALATVTPTAFKLFFKPSLSYGFVSKVRLFVFFSFPSSALSPCPVAITIGKSGRIFFSSVASSSPLRSGNPISMIAAAKAPISSFVALICSSFPGCWGAAAV